MTVSQDLDSRFREAAARSGLLDAGYDIVDSPVGPLFAAATERGLLRISFDPDPEPQIDRLARVAGPRVLRTPRRLDDLRRELDEYFEGRRRDFDLPLDVRASTDSQPVARRAGRGAVGHTGPGRAAARAARVGGTRGGPG